MFLKFIYPCVSLLNQMKDDHTVRAYDVYAEVYDAETADFWEGFPENIIDQFRANLKGKRVLDLGSGPGRDAIILRNAGLEVICVDGSKKMASMTIKNGFETIISDIRELNVDFSLYDGVWAYSSLIHIPFNDSMNLMLRLSDKMKPGTIVLLGLIKGESNEEQRLGDSSYSRYFEMFSEKKVERLISGTGFRIIGMNTYQPKNHVYMNYLLELKK